MQFVECEVMRLGLDRSNNSYVVILREKSGERLLPIWIGQAEAESIVIEMSKLNASARLLTISAKLSSPEWVARCGEFK